ncbi:MAG: multi-sensor signal transduction histidine kinase [Candidatus Saccharibacteria bacterium]|nr:multi-sensor signal transduction histidine kinase [Candidatus Saccharibacteria bacterium]
MIMNTSLTLRPLIQICNRRFITPRSNTIDDRRQEYILNILLFSLSLFAILALLISGYNYFFTNLVLNATSLVSTALVCAFIFGLLFASRKGHFKFAAVIFIGILSFAALQLSLRWSFELQQALLTFALVIVIAGVTLNARIALIFGSVLAGSFLLIGFLQSNMTLTPDTSWQNSRLNFSDTLGYAVTMLVIAVVSWLANREIDRSLKRARLSEAALAKERDNLEIKVLQRTHELEEAQLVRTMELRRFAEFGRLSANLLHEVANPLTAASLNLEQLDSEEHSNLVIQARKNLRHMERYIDAARKQLKGEGEVTKFMVRKEVAQLMRIVIPRAERSHVKISVIIQGQPKLHGDPVKFNQLLANLVLNAVESYDGLARPKSMRQIDVAIEQIESALHCTIHDNGKGIEPGELSKIFEPFYSTKSENNRSMGIGLAMVKQFVEQDYNGNISVMSDQTGTEFRLVLHSVK